MPQRLKISLLAVIFFGLFVLFSYFVAHEQFNQSDFDMTVKLQDRISHRFDLPFSVFSIIGTVEVTGLMLFILGCFLLIRRLFLTAVSLALMPLGLALEVFGKVFVLHPGPPFLFYRGVIDFDFPSHYVHTSYSYPSGHMYRTTFLITFLIVYMQLRWRLGYRLLVQLGLIGVLIIMGVSRVYLGEHWTTDVIGGALLGVSLGLLPTLFLPQQKTETSKTVVE
jgi:membrane-associated phospholipid phosphatase